MPCCQGLGDGADGHAVVAQGDDLSDDGIGSDPWASEALASGLCRCEGVAGALPDQLALEGCERGEHVCKQLPARGRHVDAQVEGDHGPFLPVGLVHQGGEVEHGPAEAVQLGHDHPIGLTGREQFAGVGEAGAVKGASADARVLDPQQLPISPARLVGDGVPLGGDAEAAACLLVRADPHVGNDLHGFSLSTTA